MSLLASTKYPNNIRTVSGTPTIYPSDVVLNCDTSGGPVIIDLLEIPANKWNTLYKLYVFDESGNAGTNNITINAPAGFFINGTTSLVISTNGGGAVIRVGNNLNYIATLNGTGGTGFSDTGWLDLQGFSWISAQNTIPQYRVINKQIVFRRNLIIPLDNAGSVLPFNIAAAPFGNNYVQSTLIAPFTGAGGGVVLSPSGTITFNNGNPVFQNAAHYPDDTYVSNFIIANRRVVSSNPAQNVAYYTTVFVMVITNTGLLTLLTLDNFEETVGGQELGQSNLRFLTSQTNLGDIILDYRTILNGGNPATLIGSQAGAMTPQISINTGGKQHAVAIDAGNENSCGGFNVPLMGISAWKN